MNADADAETGRRLRRRWWILAMLCFATLLNSLDRQTVAVLKPTLKLEFALTDADYALVVNAFTICYASAYAFSGWLVDRLGVRRALPLFMVVWSVASAGCGIVRQFVPFVALRALLGLSEPGNFPSALRAVTVWFTPASRGFATSLYNLGTVVSPLLIAMMASQFGWRSAFVLPGVVGIVLAGLWWWTYHEPKSIVAGSPQAGGGSPVETEPLSFRWAELWRTRSLWGIVACRFLSDPVWYFMLFWMPGYLQEARGLSLMQTGMLGWIPHLAATLGGFAAASTSDLLVRRGRAPLNARKRVLIPLTALAGAAALIPAIPQAGWTIALFSLMGALSMSWLYGLGTVVADAYPVGNVASVWGIAGAAGAFGAVLFNALIGRVIGSVGLDGIFISMALLHPIAALLLGTMVHREVPRRPIAASRWREHEK